MRYLKQNEMDIDKICSNISFGTLGNTTAKKLKEINCKVSFVANKPNPHSLLNAWLQFVNRY